MTMFLAIMQQEEILNPILTGLKSTNIKILYPSINASLKVISHKAASLAKVTEMVSLYSSMMDSSVVSYLDPTCLLKIIQCIVATVTPAKYQIHQDDLSKCLVISFKLLASKHPSVHQASEASIRQIFTTLLDTTYQLYLNIQDKVKGVETEYNLYVRDVVKFLKDTCCLILDVKTSWLPLTSIDKLFAFELLEELLSKHRDFCVQVPEMSLLMKDTIVPLILKVFELRREFPYLMRLIRLSISLIDNFHAQFTTACTTLLESIADMLDQPLPFWMQMLSLDAIKWFTNSGKLTQSILKNEELKDKPLLIEALNKVMGKLGRFVSKVVFTWDSSEFILKPLTNRLIDALTTSDATPTMTQSQAVTLSLYSFVGFLDCLSTVTNSFEHVDSEEYRSTYTFKTSIKVVEFTWPSILASLSTYLSKTKDDDMIQIVLKSYQSFTTTCGTLHLTHIRDELLASLSKYAVPKVADPAISDDNMHKFLTKKNIAVMKTIINIAHCMGSHLGSSWSIIIAPLHHLHISINTLKKNLKNPKAPHLSKEEKERIRDTPNKEEYEIISSALDSLFSTSRYISDDGILEFLNTLRNLFIERLSQFTSSSIIKSYHMFGFDKMIQIGYHNLQRLSLCWPIIHQTILDGSVHPNVTIRKYIVDKTSMLVEEGITLVSKEPYASLEQDSPVYVSLMILQVKLLETIEAMIGTKYEDVKVEMLEATHRILRSCGQYISTGWPVILTILLSIGVSNDPVLIPIGFKSVKVITNEYLNALPIDCIAVAISTIGNFGGRSITAININIAAIGLLWKIADFIAKAQSNIEKEVKEEESSNFVDSLWLSLFQELSTRSDSPRFEIRDCSLQTMYGILTTYGHILNRASWQCLIDRLLLPNFEWSLEGVKKAEELNEKQREELNYDSRRMNNYIMDTEGNEIDLKQWYGAQIILLTNFTRVFKSFFTTMASLDRFDECWDKLLKYVEALSESKSADVCIASLNSLKEILLTCYIYNEQVDSSILWPLYQNTWKVWQKISNNLSVSRPSHSIVNAFVENAELVFRHFSDQSTLNMEEIAKTDYIDIVDYNPVIHASEEDLERLLNVMYPILLVPLEYISEFTILRKQAFPILLSIIHSKDHKDSIPLVVSMLLNYTTRAVGIEYITNCYTPSKSILDQLNLEKPSKPTRSIDVSEDSLNLPLFNIAERSIKTLKAIWKKISFQNYVDLKKIIFADTLNVIGIAMQVKRVNPTSTLWKSAFDLFQELSEDAAILYSESNVEESIVQKAILWSSMIDSIETFLRYNEGDDYSIAEDVRQDILKIEMDLVSHLHSKLILHCPVESNLQNRLFQVLLDGCDQIKREDFMKKCYASLFKLIEIDESSSFLLEKQISTAQAALKHVMDKSKLKVQKFISDDKLSGSLPLPSSRVTEILFILANLKSLEVRDGLWIETAKVPFLDKSPKRHLWELFPLLCECITTKDPEIKPLLKEILKDCSRELGLPEI